MDFDSNSENNAVDQEDSELIESEDRQSKQQTRKRLKHPEEWKQNIRKRRRQNGLDYVNVKGKLQDKKSVKGQCNCKMECSRRINYDSQKTIHSNFWKLSDPEKNHFYCKFVERMTKARSRPRTFPLPEKPFKVYSLKYWLETDNVKIRVCKTFFLNTLDISSRRISYFFENIYDNTGTPKPGKRGKHTKKVTSSERIEEVKQHINSFPRVDSHYCRATTNKQYLEQHLTLSKMYKLYIEKYPDSPVKFNVYRTIFNTQFNIAFFKPKKDRCDFCEEMKHAINVSDRRNDEYRAHLQGKEETKAEKNKDRSMKDDTVAIISFDLQNVYALPKANVSNFFYKRKFNVYDLTAYCSINKKTYCAVWHEMISGRAGNHICSSLIKILENIVNDFPRLRKLILWSDSCVPQNRNSIMSFGLSYFLKKHPQITSIEQKFCEPGHSSIQEVDSVHSLLEKKLRYTEIYSPVSLIRNLTAIAEETRKLRIIEMKKNDFFDFQQYSSCFTYSSVPYAKVKYICLRNNVYVAYKTAFSGTLEEVRVSRKNVRNQNRLGDIIDISEISVIKTSPVMEKKKKDDIRAMLRYMAQVDRQFYEKYVQ